MPRIWCSFLSQVMHYSCGTINKREKSIRSTRRQVWVGAPAWFLLCVPDKRQNLFCYTNCKQKTDIFQRRKKIDIINKHKTYLCTSLSPLLLVISHVKPLLGSRPGWEISRPYFFTNWIYLKYSSSRGV